MRTPESLLEAARTGTVLSVHAEETPGHPALVSGFGNRTYAELDGNANRLARVLRAHGLRPGDAVALVCRNRPEFAETWAACARSGLRLTPVNWHLTGEEMAYIIGDCEAKAVVADVHFADAVLEAVAATPAVSARLCVGGALPGFSSYDDALAGADAAPLTDPSLGRMMLYTSGTTGRPKGVDRPPALPPPPAGSVYAYLAEAAQINPETDVHLCTGPLYHSAPIAFSMISPLNAGVTCVLMDGWDAHDMLRLVERHRVTHTHVVPTMMHRLLALPDEVRATSDLSSLRFVMHGAAPCPVEVKRAFIEWVGPIVHEYYAATEGGGTFVSSPQWLTRPGTVGRPSDADLVRILDDDGRPLGPGEVGTVYLRVYENSRFRYFKDDDKTAGSYRGDYFTVGDHGYLDDDGFLFLTGRVAEVIISGGVNIYPAEIDGVLLTHPAVADVGTIGVPDLEWGERVLSVVQVEPGYEPTPALSDELVAWCRDRLAHYKCPRAVDFVDVLPRHDNGKLYRRRLRERYAGIG
jgi:long-chain acyl-CoA synthetase